MVLLNNNISTLSTIGTQGIFPHSYRLLLRRAETGRTRSQGNHEDTPLQRKARKEWKARCAQIVYWTSAKKAVAACFRISPTHSTPCPPARHCSCSHTIPPPLWISRSGANKRAIPCSKATWQTGGFFCRRSNCSQKDLSSHTTASQL